ncbi:peroxisomal hydratase-dehydrogenase-epimerase, partial [Thraustotheca clavata]
MGSFDSPYIVHLVGALWTTPSTLKCVLEFMGMGDLRDYLSKHSHAEYPWHEKIKSINSVVQALVYLHSMQIIHRILKSRNVLLDSIKGTKLTDFGVSREDIQETMTVDVGTYRWVAPEILQLNHYTVAADIFSFGMLLSEFDAHDITYANVINEKNGKPLVDTAIVGMVIAGTIKPKFSNGMPAWLHDVAVRCIESDPNDCPTAYELVNIFREHTAYAFPLYPVVLLFKGDSQDVVPFPPPSMSSVPNGMPDFNPGMTLHGEQTIEIHRPLPPGGSTVTCHKSILSFHPKGASGALMETEYKMVDADGQPLATLVMGSFYRGLESTFKGQGRIAPRRPAMPKRDPDVVLALATSPAQAQFYRLSGDYNPLHIDYEFAESAGFPQPILHGLCTMGVTARALLQSFCSNNSNGFKKMSVRFSKPCFPGETLETRMWKTSASTVQFQVRVVERNTIVLDARNSFIFHLHSMATGITRFQAVFRGNRSRKLHVERVKQNQVWSPFVPCKMQAVHAMLSLGRVSAEDTLLDIGSGDGRIVFAVVQEPYSVKKAIGIDIDPVLIRQCLQSPQYSKATEFILDDWVNVNFGDVTIITMFFLPHESIARLLAAKCKPGTRVVTYVFGIAEWTPIATISTVPFL